MQSNGLCLSVFLDSFRRDGTVIPRSIASKSGKPGWPLFSLKWFIEMIYGMVPIVTEYTFIEYGAYPQPNGRRMYSYLRCKEFIVYMKAVYGDEATSLLLTKKTSKSK